MPDDNKSQEFNRDLIPAPLQWWNQTSIPSDVIYRDAVEILGHDFFSTPQKEAVVQLKKASSCPFKDLKDGQTVHHNGVDLMVVDDTIENRTGINRYKHRSLEALPFLFTTDKELDDTFYAVGSIIEAKILNKFAGAAEAVEEERYVLGVVLEPGTPDSHGDVFPESVVEKACREFYGRAGLMHQLDVTDRVQYIESYITPADMTIEGRTIKKGTWLIGAKIYDDSLWSMIKQGNLTGLSIGGPAVRVRNMAQDTGVTS